MTVKMTEEVRRALSESGNEPLRLIDPENDTAYVLVPASEYARMACDDEGDELRDTYPAQEAIAGAAGWDDPIMDEYNDYDARRPENS